MTTYMGYLYARSVSTYYFYFDPCLTKISLAHKVKIKFSDLSCMTVRHKDLSKWLSKTSRRLGLKLKV